ncbi:MAG: SUMF1/EgtB/PvdO family nonheme iron enzyme [Bryobacteraceae bacterium]
MAHLLDFSCAISQARSRTDELFGLLVPGAHYDRPIAERHRNIFYLGHLEAFDWNQICRGALGMPSFHPEFDRLFEFGIDPPPGRLPEDRPSDWPTVAEVQSYNARVRAGIDRAIAHAPEEVLHIALEHRLMHAETFAYMLHNLPADRKCFRGAPLRGLEQGGEIQSNRMVEVPAGPATLGKPHDDRFGWDNEYAEHTVAVQAFAIRSHKVTNGEYLAFVREGGSPSHFWIQRDGEWLLRTMFGEVPLPLDWPVYATLDQASGYAQWKGQALPTEAQFHRAAYGDPGTEGQPDFSAENADFKRWDPEPVTAGRANGLGLKQMVGNGWEWTSTVFQPFPGFSPFPAYPGYSANFFDGQHYVLKGASPRTAAAFLRPSFRNWFRPEYPYVFATFRTVEN